MAPTDRAPEPSNRTARIAGIWYLLCALIAPIGMVYVPSKLIVHGDALATTRNILASEGLFRIGMASELLSGVAFLLAVLFLYRLLRGVDSTQATIMAVLAALPCAAAVVGIAFELATVNLLHGNGLYAGLDPAQRQGLATLLVGLGGPQVVGQELFWGLWLLPLGMLVIRSRFLPRLIGALLLVNGVAYVVGSMTAILAPAWSKTVERYSFPALLGEIWLILWLLIRGVRPAHDGVGLAPATAASGAGG